MSAERVSRWFATGFRIGADGKPERELPLSACSNDWERGDMRCGHAEGVRGEAHLQFWLVAGEFTHEGIEKQIAASAVAEENGKIKKEEKV
jgi:hypothetical protein